MEMCVPGSENNVASGVLGLAFQINALKQDDIFSQLLDFSAPQIPVFCLQHAATLPHLVSCFL